MKFINLNTLQIETVPTYRTYHRLLGPVDKLFDLTISQFKVTLEKLLDIDETGEDAVLFEVGVEGAELEDFEYLVNVIVDMLFSMNTTEVKRNREARLAIPTSLFDAHCNDVPFRKAINNECRFNIFSIRIYDSEKGWEYKIVEE